MIAKMVDGQMQLLDREPNQDIVSGSGVETSLVDSASHVTASHIVSRSKKNVVVATRSGTTETGQRFTTYTISREVIEFTDNRNEYITRVDLVDAVSSEVMGHVHGIKLGIRSGMLEITVFYADIPGEMSYHDHQVIMNEDGSFTLLLNEGHSHTLSREAVFGPLSQALTRKSSDIVLSASTIKRLTSKGAGEMTDNKENRNENEKVTEVTDSNPEGAVVRDNKDTVTRAEFEKLQRKADLNAEQRAHFDGLDEKAQDEFLDMDEAKRAEAMKPPIERGECIEFEGEKVFRFNEDGSKNITYDLVQRDIKRTAEAATDKYVARASKEMRSIQGEEDVKVDLLRAISTISDKVKREAVEELFVKRYDAICRMVSNFDGVQVEGMDSIETVERSAEDADAEITKQAQEMVRNDKSGELTFDQAYIRVMDAPENASLKRAVRDV